MIVPVLASLRQVSQSEGSTESCAILPSGDLLHGDGIAEGVHPAAPQFARDTYAHHSYLTQLLYRRGGKHVLYGRIK